MCLSFACAPDHPAWTKERDFDQEQEQSLNQTNACVSSEQMVDTHKSYDWSYLNEHNKSVNIWKAI